MGKLSRGIGAGLVKFGESVSELSAERRRNERVDARLEKEDAFKERELSIREDESALRQKAMERQGRMDESKFRHANLVQSLSAAGDNQTAQAAAYSKWFPDKRQYTVNREKAINMENGDGDNPYMVWDVSYNATNESGQMIPDPTTGKTKQLDGPNGPKVFWTKDEYTNFVANTLNPDVFTALAMQALTDKQAYTTAFNNEKARLDAQAGAQEAFSKTPAGIEQARGQKAKTDLNIARAGQADRSPQASSAGNKSSSVVGLDGKEVQLTTPQVNQLINDTKSLKELFPGVTSGEAYRFARAMEDPSKSRLLNQLAQAVTDEKISEADAVASIMEDYRMKKSVAAEILAESKRGLESNKQGWWKRLLGGSGPVDEQP